MAKYKRTIPNFENVRDSFAKFVLAHIREVLKREGKTLTAKNEKWLFEKIKQFDLIPRRQVYETISSDGFALSLLSRIEYRIKTIRRNLRTQCENLQIKQNNSSHNAPGCDVAAEADSDVPQK